MYSIILYLFITKTVNAQFNGEFWWLNDKLAKFNGASEKPKYEKLSAYDTDEGDKIVFRDDGLFPNGIRSDELNDKRKTSNEKWKMEMKFQDKSAIAWPDEEAKMEEVVGNNRKEEVLHESPTNDDVLEFAFPDTDNIIWNDKVNKTSPSVVLIKETLQKNKSMDSKQKKVIYINNKLPINVQNEIKHKEDVPETENICSFMKKDECNRINGVIYIDSDRGTRWPFFETQLICCILPIPKRESSRIYFRDDFKRQRNKRSGTESKMNPALSQRDALLFRNYASQIHKIKPTESPAQIKNTPKISTPEDEYVDPYWNVKGTNNKNPNRQSNLYQQTNTKYEYDSEDYIEDYIVEVPSPGGLVGLYSDNKITTPSWPIPNGNTGLYGISVDDDEEDDVGTSFAYGTTIDPRLENRRATTSPPPIRGRPVKLTTASSFEHYGYDSQTITYNSNPDFQVLQGFKLLNLMQNRSRIYKGRKTTTTESIFDNSEESVLNASLEDGYDELVDKAQQVYKRCGRVQASLKEIIENDKEFGEAEIGSHPWLGLVVLTRKRQSVICYATLVHPRAAVTTGDCVHGRTSPGQITLIAGAWDLKAESREGWQKRLVSVRLHPGYKAGDLAHDLAILYWKRPLRLRASVQPTCLSDPHVGDTCLFHGWGGYDQAMRQHSRWQRATILTPGECNARLSSSERGSVPPQAFCASVYSRGTVTGIGGPLTCSTGGRHVAAGIAVWRDHVVVLLPAHEWTLSALDALLLQ